MAGDLDPAPVRLGDRGAELGASDVGVGFEPGRALGHPVVDKMPCFVRGVEDGHDGTAVLAVARDVRGRDVDVGPWLGAGFDRAFRGDIGIG